MNLISAVETELEPLPGEKSYLVITVLDLKSMSGVPTLAVVEYYKAFLRRCFPALRDVTINFAHDDESDGFQIQVSLVLFG